MDLLQQTKHEQYAELDFERLHLLGIATVRTTARWHLIEQSPGKYSFESLARILDAARKTETEILLDLFHFGWPSHYDVFSKSFSKHFRDYVAEIARWLQSYGDVVTTITPINEISFLSWAGGEVGDINPFTIGRGDQLKQNLVLACLAGIREIRAHLPNVKLLAPEPIIHIVGNPTFPDDDRRAAAYTLSQYEAWDMLTGRLAPELGGRADDLDIVGANFYARNQWINFEGPLQRSDPRWRPLRLMLQDLWSRYGRPILISETGTEDEDRAPFFRYVTEEVYAARAAGVPVCGICLYPICNYPGWAEERHCRSGLFDYADESGNREVYEPLARELRQAQSLLGTTNEPIHT